MAVLTISRKLGSGGDQIAQKVAETLGYKLVDKDFIGAVLEEYGLVEFDREYDHLPSIWERLDLEKSERREVLVNMLDRVVCAVARLDDVVILGRSGYVILKEFVNVLNIRVQAPLAYRAMQIAAEQDISLPKAEEIATQNDKVRANFVETYYGIDWEDCSPFDIVVNMEKLPADFTAESLVEALRALDAEDLGAAQTTASIPEDANLREAILEQFD